MYNRKIFNELEHRLKAPRHLIQTVLGPRQVGKTTGVRAVLERLSCPFVMVSADEPILRDRDWLMQEWERARVLAESSGKAILAIDEIQKIENWSETVKALWDRDTAKQVPLAVVLLGSSTVLIEDGLSESLAGRFEVLQASHWSFNEVKEAFGLTVEEWAFFGGYPGPLSLRDHFARWSSYIRDSLIETTVSRDILMKARVEKPALLRRLFELSCLYSGQVLSLQKITGQLQDAGNISTLQHYLELLGRAGLVTGLSKYSSQPVRARASSPKLLALNTALRSALQTRSLAELKAAPQEWGRQMESAVGAHLMSTREPLMSVHWWREGQFEVDYVLTWGDRVAALEIKTGAPRAGVSGLKEFCSRVPQARPWLIGGERGIPFEEFFLAPLRSWF